MNFKKSEGSSVRVKKASETGAVYYFLWHDESRSEYVQIVDNVGGGGVGVGSHSELLFPVDVERSGEELIGYDPDTGLKSKSSDNNMKAFLRVAREDRKHRRQADADD